MKLDISKAWNAVKGFSASHSPAILTGVGIAGMIFTVIEAVHATPKAMKMIEERTIDIPEPKTSDKVKACWKCYIPTVISGAASIAVLIFANRAGEKQRAALSAAYTIAETSLSEYRHKVEEKFGKRKEESVRDDIAKDKIAGNPPVEKEVIVTGKGETLCLDTLCGKYFRSDIEKLRRIENDLNYRMRTEMNISLNEYYVEIGLPPVDVGDMLGWNIDKGLITLKFSAQLTPEGEPCLAVSFEDNPGYYYE